MTSRLQIVPARADRPFVRPHGDGVVFSAVLFGENDLGIQLIRIEDGNTLFIPFTEEYRVGRVYSVRITPFDSGAWVYRYRSGGAWVHDPHAMGIRKVLLRCGRTGETEEVTACSCAPLDARALFHGAPEKPLPPADWTQQVIYGIHPKGFTAAKPEGFPGRGRFEGIISMIPYLQSLGVTAVELMPVYQPLPDLHRKRPFRTMQEALRAWPVGPQGDPLRDLKERPNYWGYGRGLYCALRPEYGTQEEFARMVHALHEAGLRVILQICFEKGIPVPEQIRLLRFYVSRYGIDGFRLMGTIPSAAEIASSPALADTALFYESFPFDRMAEEEEASRMIFAEDMGSLFQGIFSDESSSSCPAEEKNGGVNGKEPGAAAKNAASRASQSPQQLGAVSYPNLITSTEDFQTLLRRFVKSDDYAMTDFLRLFLGVPAGHGELRSVTGFFGFTLADLVSYNERHNEANGEFGLDGRAENFSWNCGTEGDTEDPEILALRRKQMRNFLTLLILSQGTPMLLQGDERANSQGGNNNPYCQDNETSWVDWSESKEKADLTAFTKKLTVFRREHPVFRSASPFQYIDYLGIGHPDVSLHGEKGWMPDLGPTSHSIGICYCENYAKSSADQEAVQRKPDGSENDAFYAFTYLAVNMYWKDLSLALPKLPPHYRWEVIMDTEEEEGFIDDAPPIKDRHFVPVSARSIRIVRSVYDENYEPYEETQEPDEEVLTDSGTSEAAEETAAEETAVEETAIEEIANKAMAVSGSAETPVEPENEASAIPRPADKAPAVSETGEMPEETVAEVPSEPEIAKEITETVKEAPAESETAETPTKTAEKAPTVSETVKTMAESAAQ